MIVRFITWCARWLERRRDPEQRRPGDDGQWRNWLGPDGHPLPIRDQEQADRPDREGWT